MFNDSKFKILFFTKSYCCFIRNYETKDVMFKNISHFLSKKTIKSVMENMEGKECMENMEG